MTPTGAELLADVRSWRTRVRDDRRGYAFPLFLFGALILLAALCYVPATPTDAGDFVPMFAGDLAYPGLIGWYWVLTIVGGLALTAGGTGTGRAGSAWRATPGSRSWSRVRRSPVSC